MKIEIVTKNEVPFKQHSIYVVEDELSITVHTEKGGKKRLGKVHVYKLYKLYLLYLDL